MAREELAISMVFSPTPWQNWRRPPPEPPEPTTGVLNCGKLLPNSSATMLAKGRTVDEPAIWRVSRAMAAVEKPTARPVARATPRVRLLTFILMILSAWGPGTVGSGTLVRHYRPFAGRSLRVMDCKIGRASCRERG